jgi:hypothetical protein
MTNTLEIGTEVRDREHPLHVGRIEQSAVKGAYVRWHKGYASWLPWGRVARASDIVWGTQTDSVGDPKREPPDAPPRVGS